MTFTEIFAAMKVGSSAIKGVTFKSGKAVASIAMKHPIASTGAAGGGTYYGTGLYDLHKHARPLSKEIYERNKSDLLDMNDHAKNLLTPSEYSTKWAPAYAKAGWSLDVARRSYELVEYNNVVHRAGHGAGHTDFDTMCLDAIAPVKELL
jgi:hypothetical protein